MDDFSTFRLFQLSVFKNFSKFKAKFIQTKQHQACLKSKDNRKISKLKIVLNNRSL